MIVTTNHLTNRFRAIPVSELASIYEECDRDPERTAHELLVLAALADSQTAKKAKKNGQPQATGEAEDEEIHMPLTEQDEELLISEYIWEEVTSNFQVLTSSADYNSTHTVEATAAAASSLASAAPATTSSSSSTTASSSNTKTSKKDGKPKKKKANFFRRYHEKKSNKRQERVNEERRLRAIHTLALQFPDLSVAEIEHALREKQNTEYLKTKPSEEHDSSNKKKKDKNKDAWFQHLPLQELMELSENKKIARVKAALLTHDTNKDKDGHKCTVVSSDLQFVISDPSDVDLEIRVVLAENEWSVEKATSVFQSRVTDRTTKMKDKAPPQQTAANRDAWAQTSMHTIRNARKQTKKKVENEVEAQDTQAETLRKSRQHQVMVLSRAQLAADLERILSVQGNHNAESKYLHGHETQPPPPSAFPSQTKLPPPIPGRDDDDAQTRLFVDTFIKARKQRAMGQKGRRAPSRFQSRIQTS